MNLVISGPIDVTLRNLVVALSKPRRVVPLHARADRLEGADDSAAVRTQVATLCDAARVDHAYIEEGVRFADFKLLAMDMDSTLITIECIDEIADFAGKKKEVAAITEAVMRGEITDFAESLRRRVALLAGANVAILSKVFDQRLQLSPGATTLIKTARENKIHTVLVSGGFTYFTDRLCKLLSIDECHANVLESNTNHLLTGRLKEPIFDATAKRTSIVNAMRTLDCRESKVMVVGDGANDLPMMNLTKYSIGYHAKPIVKSTIDILINYGPLTTLLDYFD